MRILIVDDEAVQRELLGGFLKKQGCSVIEAASGQEAIERFLQQPVDLVLLDHKMPDLMGDEVLTRIKEINPLTRVIMITAFGAVETAVRVMQLGADDFMEKPIDLETLLTKIRSIEDALFINEDVAQVEESIDANNLPVRMIATSTAMQQVLSLALRAAPSPWTVLIHGETGTGKDLIARLIHQLSPRNDKPFIPLNCAAVPEGLFESELFGHEKGAFTGAANRRRGVFEQANQGTLFLDEVGELPLAVQAKLLRALQEKTITRVGGEQQLPVDVRIVAATNRDLKAMSAEGNFREDLYFRLNVITIDIPPLRQRKEDIPALIEFLLAKYQSDARFDDQALHQLTKYHFPGNIRELEHILQRTVTLSRSPQIGLRDLPPEIRDYHGPESENGDLNQKLAEIERQMLMDALEKNDGVQTRAAQSLGISERVLRYKMEKLGINRNLT
ncbi:sigma-54-dependent Fis family transcriptional regulator [Desulfobulbus rhabdoformis]|jgi:two-component system response regulator AtoC|uniref:sigma-54-dependent transcriptional regulator n=1 Tax=Desulfobulbus rhabdoformis TaxID=34032 RepID=UPI001962A853|nr:sigma-54 dependent transcriptional regulator [Desulfobulbus rhabdoformis]MBM9616547.1 sigma-54-dependent Fis family transcriptional regulator [Desulfobulbus rhabdoformis]